MLENPPRDSFPGRKADGMQLRVGGGTGSPLGGHVEVELVARFLYSAFKNAIAPSAICLAIRFILSVPSSCLATQEDLMKVYNKAITPKTGMR